MLLLFVVTIGIGILVGIFILLPVNELAYYHRPDMQEDYGLWFARDQLYAALRGETPLKVTFYTVVGGLLGLITALIYMRFHYHLTSIQQLSNALGKDIELLIARGEGPELEFKSSFRWDYQQQSVNRALEFVILKTIAGFLNGSGGTLLIGISDDQQVLGLEQDFNSLKRKDEDGFEQTLMTAIASQLGTDMCQYTHCVFHAINGKAVCRVIVAKSPRPVYIKKSGDIKFYLRSGGGTRELNVQEVVDYTASHWKK